MNTKSYNFFMNFANKSRFDIIMALRKGPLSVSEIVKKVGEEQSAVSHNLIKLKGCRLLDVKQNGKQRIYYLNKETVLPLLETVEMHVKKYCSGRCRK